MAKSARPVEPENTGDTALWRLGIVPESLGDWRLKRMAMKEFVRRVGVRIRHAREAKGWTQLQLADALPGQRYSSQISVWETGRAMPNLRNLEALATALDVPVEAFFTDPPPQ